MLNGVYTLASASILAIGPRPAPARGSVADVVDRVLALRRRTTHGPAPGTAECGRPRVRRDGRCTETGCALPRAVAARSTPDGCVEAALDAVTAACSSRTPPCCDSAWRRRRSRLGLPVLLPRRPTARPSRPLLEEVARRSRISGAGSSMRTARTAASSAGAARCTRPAGALRGRAAARSRPGRSWPPPGLHAASDRRRPGVRTPSRWQSPASVQALCTC